MGIKGVVWSIRDQEDNEHEENEITAEELAGYMTA